MYNTEVETPRYDAGTGKVLLGDGKGQFSVVSPTESGFFTQEDVKGLAIIRQKEGFRVAAAVNNGPVQFFKFHFEK